MRWPWYRNGAHLLGEELIGGVSQVQANCRIWETEGSRTEGNREDELLEGCYTIQPKGILIIGHNRQLSTKDKRVSFEMFRRNTQNPAVITYDELLERAKHLLLKEEQEIKSPNRVDDEEF